MTTQKSPRRLKEFKELVEVARACVAGERHWSCACTAASALENASKIYVVDARIKEVAADWAAMSVRVWPEFGLVSNPVSPDEFIEWMRGELQVFDLIEPS